MVTTVSDLLGRQVSYTDVWGTVTTTVYNPAGQVVSTTATPPSGSGGSASVLTWSYDAAGQTTFEYLNGQTIANVGYDTTDPELLRWVSYNNGTGNAGNGSALSWITYDASLREQQLTWTTAGGGTSSDAEVYSEAGKVLTDTATASGGTARTSSYTYDTAGRLTQAVIPGHTLSYGFGTATCGADTSAGKDGNRTSYTDVQTTGSGAGTHSVAYCYDNADRLTGTTVSNPVSGASPVFGQALTASGSSASIVYDAHGNTTTLADESISYDSTDRHVGTTLTDGTSVTYVRDVADRVVAQTTTQGGVTTSVRYGYTGSDDAPDYTYTGTGALSATTLSLPGGASVEFKAGVSGAAGQVWSYPNLHGDTWLTTDGAATITGTYNYDPFGDPIDPTTGNIGTVTADDASASNTMTPGSSYGWEGSHEKLFQHAGDLAIIEMGARQYVPSLGRFLGVDPVPGGNSNDYNYPNDPISKTDLDGRRSSASIWWHKKKKKLSKKEQKKVAISLEDFSTIVGTIGSALDVFGVPEVGLAFNAVGSVSSLLAAGSACEIANDDNCKVAWSLFAANLLSMGASGALIKMAGRRSMAIIFGSGEAQIWIMGAGADIGDHAHAH